MVYFLVLRLLKGKPVVYLGYLVYLAYFLVGPKDESDNYLEARDRQPFEGVTDDRVILADLNTSHISI